MKATAVVVVVVVVVANCTFLGIFVVTCHSVATYASAICIVFTVFIVHIVGQFSSYRRLQIFVLICSIVTMMFSPGGVRLCRKLCTALARMM